MLKIIFDTHSVECVTFNKFICFLIFLFDYLFFDLKISWIGELTAIICQNRMDCERHTLIKVLEKLG